jgi:CRP-like cAMP-binding protein
MNPPISDVDERVRAAIAAAAPFKEAPKEAIIALAAAGGARSYAAGESVFALGQYDGSEFLVIASGRLRASSADAATGAVLFEEAGPGDCLGLAFAAAGVDAARAAAMSIAALEQSEVVAVDSEALRDLAAQRPSLARCLMVHFARRLSGEPAAAESSPERRVYAALSEYIERDPISASWRVPKMPKHRELADRAAVDESDAANAVAKLIQSGVARRDYPGLVIDDIAQLNRLSR